MVNLIPDMIKAGGHRQIDVRYNTLVQKDMGRVYSLAGPPAVSKDMAVAASSPLMRTAVTPVT